MVLWSLRTIAAVIVAASAGFAGYFGGRIRSKTWRIIISIIGIAAITGNPYIVALAYAVSAATYALARAGKI